MKKQISSLILLLGFMVFLTSCQSKKSKSTDENLPEGVRKVTVEEVIQASSYTYCRATEDGEGLWIATSKADIKEGGIYYFKGEMEMNNFQSKELNKTFESILFVQEISDQPISKTEPIMPQGQIMQKPSITKHEITLDKTEEDITVAKLYSDRESYKEKVIKIKGQVVKFSPNIMNKNWIHIQDGTEDNGNYDLTVTTLEEVKVGDNVVFEGKIALNRDFGAGYSYEVIMEDAKLITE